MKKKSKKIMDVITGIMFIALLVFASGFDRATTFTYIGISVCFAWLLFAVGMNLKGAKK